jgi:hypothetical protein
LSEIVGIRIVKSRQVQWAGNVARKRDARNAYRILIGKFLGNAFLKDKYHDISCSGSSVTVGVQLGVCFKCQQGDSANCHVIS